VSTAQEIRIQNTDLEQLVPLTEFWVTYGKTLSLTELDSLQTFPTDFPHLWRGQVYGSDTLSNIGFATYRLKITMENPHPPVSLMLEDSYTAYHLYVNGELMAVNGKVSENKEDYREEWLPQVIRLPEDASSYDLVLQLANFSHFKGGMSEPILIGTTEKIEYFDLERKAYSLMLTGSLILGGLFFIGLYWFGRNDLSMYYFSLFCLTYTYRIIGTDYYVLHHIIPEMSWNVAIRLEYISLYVSIFFFVRFVYNLFPQEANKKIADLISVISIGLALISLFTTPYFFSQLITPYFILLIFLIFYGSYVFYQAYRNKQPGAQYAILSVVVVIMVFLALLTDYFGWYTASDGVLFLGYIAFFFSQSLILSYRFSNRLSMSLLEAEDASRVKTDFLSTISHELRTPLNAITGMTRLLEDTNLDPEQMEYLKSLKLSSNNLIALVNDILDFSKIEKGEITVEKLPFLLIDSFDQVQATYESVAGEKNIAFIADIDPRFFGLRVLSDQTRFNQVLNNLVSNAIKFTDKGSVKLRAEWIEEDAENVTIHIEVEDTGIGIAADKLENIFYQFTQLSSSSTRQFGGVGLGLSIVRNILQALGSKITVASAEGEGSRFGFVLTLAKVASGKKSKQNGRDVSSPTYSGKTVLLVEDNMMNAMIAEQFLNAMNFDVVKVENGHEAVEKVFKNDYDLILMDIHMPVKDGYQAASEILINKPYQKIIALTASISSSDIEKLKNHGFLDSLIKPFRKEELEAKIENVLAG
jgi:signal transduction histidine kinase/BarA-like signal transduction histidine kinase